MTGAPGATGLLRRAISHPALSIGSAVLWGMLEFIALQRSRLGHRSRRHAPLPR